MINYKEVTKTIITKEIVSIICDICKTTYDIDNIFEVQEFHHINFTGGYGSVFGDGSRIECNICQHCLYEMIKGKYRESELD